MSGSRAWVRSARSSLARPAWRPPPSAGASTTFLLARSASTSRTATCRHFRNSEEAGAARGCYEVAMIQKLSHVTVYVTDQDRAKDFYVGTLGFEVRTDATMGPFRWLTVGPKGQPDLELILMKIAPGPMMDEAAANQLRALVEKGGLGCGVLETADVRRDYEELSRKGVRFSDPPRSAPTASRRCCATTPATGSAFASGRLRSEDRLGDHAVDALADVHHLADPAVGGHRRQRVGLLAREPLLLHQEVHRLRDGVGERLHQILVEAHQDVVGLGLDAGPAQLHVLVDDGLQPDLLVRALQGGEVHLAVALRAVRVARPDQPALEEHRDVDGAALGHLVDVHVGAVLPGPQRAHRCHRVLGPALARRGIVGIDAHRQRPREG